MSQEEIMKIFMTGVEKAWQDAIQYPQPVADITGYEEGAWNKWLWHVVEEGDRNSWHPIVTQLEEEYNILITYSSPFFKYYHQYDTNMRTKLIEMAKQKEIQFGRDAVTKRRKDTENRYYRPGIEAPVPVVRATKVVPEWPTKKKPTISWMDVRWKDMFG